MSERNIFEIAARKATRFNTTSGVLSVEDLWNLPLQHSTKTNLDQIAIKLNDELEASGQRSFVSTKPVGNVDLEFKLEILKHIISVKLAEEKLAAERRELKEKKAKLLAVIEKKQQEATESLSLEEAQKQYAELGE